VGVGAEATPIAGLKLDLDFLYNFDNASAMYLLSEPNMRGNISAEYTLRKWKFYVGGELLGARSCSVIREGVLSQYDMPLAFDLGAGLSYRINRHIELYADGKNLLNSKIYDFADYYRPGAGFMLGIKMDF
jgi:outer membrane receptor protein involved in Fe transport